MPGDSLGSKLDTGERKAVRERFVRDADPYFNLLDPQRQDLTRRYLTTDETLGDLAKDTGRGLEAVRYLITTAVQKLFHRLPEEKKRDYISPQFVYHLKAGFLSPTSKQKMLQRLIDPETGTYKETHRQNASNAAFKRWERERQRRQNLPGKPQLDF